METKNGIFFYTDSSRSSEKKKGPLTGKSVSVQPNMSVRGWPTEAGSKALERFVALEDATVVERLKQAGASIPGSTHMSELGFGLTGDTGYRAVAEGRVNVALITDTMGEARIAAAAAGVFGFKPTHGIVSRFGLIGLIPSMECYGMAAKTVEDIAAVMAVISGSDERDFSMPEYKPPDFGPGVVKQEFNGAVGVVREAAETLAPGESAAFKAALSKLEKSGLKTVGLSLKDFGLFRVVHNVVGSAEASSSGGKYDGVRYGHRTDSAKDWNEMYLKSRAESFGMPVKAYLFQGAYFQFRDYSAFENACRVRARLIKETDALFEKVGILAFPARRTSSDDAAADSINGLYDIFSLTLPANVAGLPSVSIPGVVLDGGTDLGLQIAGPRLSDARLLAAAARISLIKGAV